jgi:hypothetical protein
MKRRAGRVGSMVVKIEKYNVISKIKAQLGRVFIGERRISIHQKQAVKMSN